MARVWGLDLLEDGHRLGLRAVPLYGRWDPEVTGRVLAPIAVAILVVWWGPRVAASLRFGSVLACSALASATWSISLALVDGVDALTAPLVGRHEQLPFARGITDVGAFLDTFTDRLATYPIHVQGHPPGTVVLFATLDRVGLGGSGWIAALVIGAGASAVASTLVLTRETAGERVARAAAPFLVLLPAAIWLATTVDALYAGVGLGGVALLAVAARHVGVRLAICAVAAGALLGVALHLSYGLGLLAAFVVIPAWWRRRVDPLLWAVLGGSVVTAAFLLAGFAWWDGLAATHDRYVAGIASSRPYGYSLVGNLAALAIAAGPAVALGLTRIRGRAWLVVGPAVAAVLAADLLGLSRGEVERIWLFLVPPLAVACAALAPRARAWLAVQAGAAIVLACLLRTPW